MRRIFAFAWPERRIPLTSVHSRLTRPPNGGNKYRQIFSAALGMDELFKKKNWQPFIVWFEAMYCRKPVPSDVDGKFKTWVARDLNISPVLARYYLLIVTKDEDEEDDGAPCTVPIRPRPKPNRSDSVRAEEHSPVTVYRTAFLLVPRLARNSCSSELCLPAWRVTRTDPVRARYGRNDPLMKSCVH
jgi:hypothetical protein